MSHVHALDPDMAGKVRAGVGEAGWSDAGVADLAARQHGVVARRQLADLGFTRHAIDDRLAAGRLHVLHRGVYAVGHRRLSRRGHWMAAALAAGPGALLSHRSAAAPWGLIQPPSTLPHVLVFNGRRRHSGLILHQSRSLTDADRAVIDNIPVTSLARTLFDFAATEPQHRFDRAVEEAERRGVFDLRAVERLLARFPRAPGRKALFSSLATFQEPAFTRSDTEREFLKLVRRAGLPAPAMNLSVAGHEVDAYWANERLIVELDAFGTHGTPQAFERDRLRDDDLALAGIEVRRITWRRVQDAPGEVAGRLAAHLARRRRELGAFPTELSATPR